jgi:hypothetical protein
MFTTSSIKLPMNERVKHIIKDYPHWLEDIDNLYKILGYLKQFASASRSNTCSPNSDIFVRI